MELTLKLQSVSAKNGVATYKADKQRSTGIVYLTRKMYGAQPPESITINGEDIQAPAPPVEKAAEPEAVPA